MLYASSFVMSSAFFRVKETVIRGCKKVTEEEILELSGIAPSTNIMSVNLEKISRTIETHPWIKTVSVGKIFPRRIIIDITEREPVAILREDDTLYLVDRDGEVFKKFISSDNIELPVLAGVYEAGRVDRELLVKALELITNVTGRSAFPATKDISEIHADRVYGFTLFTNDRKLVHLGFGDYDRKFAHLNRLLSEAFPDEKNKGFVKIDLENMNRIIVKRWQPEVEEDMSETKKTSL
jgi:cell division protein FtsQ